MKGVVLAGGVGTRLRPLTFSMAKQLVPVANKPILFYGLEDLARCGIQEVAIVISPETGDEVRRAVGDGGAFGLAATYLVQDQPRGLAHGLGLALPWADGDDVLMYLGDNLLKGGVGHVVEDFRRTHPNCQILLCEVDNPSSFGVAELDHAGKVIRLVEKPPVSPSNLALVGVYLFDYTVQEAIAAIRPSARGELEITEAIQYLLTSGRQVRSSLVRGWWKDTGKKEDLLDANQLVLADLVGKTEGELVDCRLRGPVRVGPGSHLIDCVITGPAIIGSDCQLSRVVIGPNTALGDGCRLSDATVEASIVLEGAQIHGWKLRNSLIGRDAQLHGSAPSGYVEMTLGDRSEVLGE